MVIFHLFGFTFGCFTVVHGLLPPYRDIILSECLNFVLIIIIITCVDPSKSAQIIIAVGIALGILLGMVITAGTAGYCACKKSSGNSGIQTKAGRDVYHYGSTTYVHT